MADTADKNEARISCCKCSLEYLSAACNRTPLCVDWGRNGWVAYGACHSIALWLPKRAFPHGSVKYILNGHKDRVNCVKWIPHPALDDEYELVSGSTDKTVIVWQRKTTEDYQWKVCAILEGHEGAVNSVAAMTIQVSKNNADMKTIIVSASADSSVRIWERIGSGDKFTCLQTLSFGKGFILAVAVSILPGTVVPVIACGGEDSKVHLFTQKYDKFVKVQSLLGHEDWIRGVEFTKEDRGDLLLASCAQDTFIRIWRVSSDNKVQEAEPEILCDKMPELKLTSNIFSVADKGLEREFSVVLESVLTGHEGWIYGVHWHPFVRKDDGSITQPMSLLTASMDKTLIVWTPEEDSGVWLEKVRVGEVGGTTLGFYGGVFSPDGHSILGHGYQGAFHLWNNVTHESESRWEPGVAVSGHFGPVQDIDWDPVDGQFLVSVSSDQTTRLHAAWKRDGLQSVWCEIARPQVHGYDMQCLSMLSRYRLASGADEKVLRIFTAPRQFMETFQGLCKVQENSKIQNSLPIGASVPALGLSNKAVFDGDLDSLRRDLEDPARPMKSSAFASEEPAPFTPVSLKEPPTEDILHQNTLWPEVQKLYGHGYEIFCVASSPDGKLLASACKASKPEHAALILWDTATWRQLCSLSSHTLTVTQIAFDHSGHRLLSVSRDRCWSVFKRKDESEEGPLFRLVTRSDKKNQHARIIWSCAWSSDDKYFATASRDKKVIIWGDVNLPKDNWQAVSSSLDVGEPATAVDISPVVTSNCRYTVAVGTESGRIALYSWYLNEDGRRSGGWNLLHAFDQSICHVLTVRRLRWRKTSEYEDNSCLQLASCSLDHSVRIYNIDITS
ncbi:elongator complex protein 2-like [Porites lutea]|uniref:elongator complex protein 2-like n=1 Tax=Porites lutea TaxID=51062 RepID=UPI003CC5C2E7